MGRLEIRMSRGWAVGVLGLVMVLESTAWAQRPARARRFEAGATATLWFPRADADDYADASPGVRAKLAYWVMPMVAVAGSFDWVFVNEETGGSAITYYGIGVGGLITTPRPARIKPFGEAQLVRYTLDNDAGVSETAYGFHLGGGARMQLRPSLTLVGQASYSAVSFQVGFFNLDVSALILEAGVSAQF